MIVESPGKLATIRKYLGSDWMVEASVGHVNDLPSKGGLGVNKETLEINYQLTERGKDVVKKLKQRVKQADMVYLATDLDREGEAIAEALRKELSLTEYKRCVFDEITKTAIMNALASTRKIDYDLVHAQETRRIFDRVVGWDGTKALTNHLGVLSPVGRVQSQAVHIIVKREREIEAFVETEHYSVKAWLENSAWNATLDLKKSGLGEKINESNTLYWLDKTGAEKLKEKLRELEVMSCETQPAYSKAPPAFRTSTMQQSAYKKLGLSIKDTDAAAQSLYQQGLITYIRTDSTSISDDGYKLIKNYAEKHGLTLANEKQQGKKGAVAQEAHECIRPTDFEYKGADLTGNEKALYELIWQRAVASQLAAKVSDVTTIWLKSNIEGKDYWFKASGSVVTFKGWTAVYSDDESDKKDENDGVLEKKEVGAVLPVTKSALLIKKTKPPEYFDEATLNDYLDRRGIGRPSTTAKILEKIGEKGHGYIRDEKLKGKKTVLRPNASAFNLVDAIGDDFSIMDEQFTFEMEEGLDKIANGELDHVAFTKKFLHTFDEEVEVLNKKEKKFESEPCDKCNSPMMRLPAKGKKSFYWRCTNQECNNMCFDRDGKPVTQEAIENEQKERLKPYLNSDGTAKFPCPQCQEPLYRLESRNKPGVYYWRCSAPKDKCEYMDYDDSENQRPAYMKNKELLNKYSNDDGTPIHPCPQCLKALVMEISKKGNKYWHCIDKKNCDYMAYHNDETNAPVSENEKQSGGGAKHADWFEKEKKVSTDANGNYLWHCVHCKEPLHQKLSKSNNIYYQCINAKCKQRYYDKDGEPNLKEYPDNDTTGKKGTLKPKNKAPKPKGA